MVRPDDPAPLRLSVDDEGNPVLHLTGELDAATANGLGPIVDEVIAECPQHLSFDLAGVTFMDSTGLALLVHASRKVRSIEMREAQPAVRRLIEVAGLEVALGLQPMKRPW